MAQLQDRFSRSNAPARTAAAVDEGLRSYMLSVYNYMSAGIGLTGLAAYVISAMAVTSAVGGHVVLTPVGQMLYQSPLKYVVMFAPLAFVWYLSARVYKMSVASAQLAFWLFAAVMGLSLSSIFLVFSGQSITQVFFVTAAAFAGLSLVGYTTKRDLSGWGSFLIMGVIGVLVASVVNLFLQSNAVQFAIAVIGVLVFAGLTAYDTQRIKTGYYRLSGDATAVAKGAIMGALSLYLDFINMFIFLLQLFGSRR